MNSVWSENEKIVMLRYPKAKCLIVTIDRWGTENYIIMKDKTKGWIQYEDWDGWLSHKKYSEESAWKEAADRVINQ